MRYALLITLPLSIIATATNAAEIALRERAAPLTSVVRLGDIAEVNADTAIEAARLAALPLMPAPAEGSPSFLRVAEVRDLLAGRGVSLNGLRFTGAETVAIGTAASTPETSRQVAAPTTSNAATVSDDAVSQQAEEQLVAAITNYLRQQSSHDLWSVKVDADNDVLAAVIRSGPEMVLRGGKAPWAGRQRFMISGNANAKPVMAYARIERLEMAAFAMRAIERGDLIRRTDVEMRPQPGALPTQAITSPESIIGKEAVQSIRPDALLLSNQVRSPIVVHRGERVSVRARAAGITVRTFAVAQQEGGVGELVMVQSVGGKDRYSARVTGLRELEVFAAGTVAADIAAAPQSTVR